MPLGLRERLKRCFLRSHRETASDDADWIDDGRTFHACAPATKNARSPSVERRIVGTTNCDVIAERSCFE